MNPWLVMSGSALAALIRERKATSVDIVGAHIDHAKAVNPSLNAIVRPRFDDAMREAQAADARVRSDDTNLPPFHGVPCTIKEAFAFTGMPQTSGLRARIGTIADHDAPAVARLRAAGAIPIGVTNVSELCMWMESDNLVYGRTNNPYDTTRTAGGSSGGEGAIIGAGASPFGLGSDVGGSIRMPSFFNGVFGHKPTPRLVPNTGQFPNAVGSGHRFLTTGPLARRAEDLMPLLRILAGPDGADSECTHFDLGDPQSIVWSRLRVVDIPDNEAIEITGDLRSAQVECARGLESLGARLVHQRFSLLRKSVQIWSCMMADSPNPSFASLMGQGIAIDAWRELGRWALRRSAHTFPAIGLSLVEKIPARFPSYAQRLVEQGEQLRAQLIDAIGQYGVALYPSYAEPAPRHGVPIIPPPRWAYTAIFNAMGFPVTQVPMGLSAQGLPLGLQIVSIPGNDHLTIGVACAVERLFGGWVAPSKASGRAICGA